LDSGSNHLSDARDQHVQRTVGGDPVPPDYVRIEVRIAELKQLFDAMDPSPFRERDLDPKAEEFIVAWARESPRDARLAMVVHLARAPGRADEATAVRDAVHEYFRRRAKATRRRLRDLLGRGRISLVMGVATLGTLFALASFVGGSSDAWGFRELFRESPLIGGWVAMWRPLEVFLYDWWPIRAEARQFDRLGIMPVGIVYDTPEQRHAGQTASPAIAPSEELD
jgi:hypothetical protein